LAHEIFSTCFQVLGKKDGETAPSVVYCRGVSGLGLGAESETRMEGDPVIVIGNFLVL